MKYKEQETTLDQLLYEMIIKNEENIIRGMSDYYRKERVSKTFFKKILSNELKKSIELKIIGISDYFLNEFNNHINKNLTNLTEKKINEFLNSNVNFIKKFDEKLEDYLKKINFEENIVNFFEKRKELILNEFIKNMFINKDK